MSEAWSTEKPKVSGYYWARGMFKVTVDKILEVIEIVAVNQEEKFVLVIGQDMWTRIDEYTHWIGPLNVPDPPKIE